MGYFGSKYAKIRPTKYRRQDPVNRKKINRQQENSTIVNRAVNEILLYENQKASAEKRARENNESDFDESELYQIDNMSLDDTK